MAANTETHNTLLNHLKKEIVITVISDSKIKDFTYCLPGFGVDLMASLIEWINLLIRLHENNIKNLPHKAVKIKKALKRLKHLALCFHGYQYEMEQKADHFTRNKY